MRIQLIREQLIGSTVHPAEAIVEVPDDRGKRLIAFGVAAVPKAPEKEVYVVDRIESETFDSAKRTRKPKGD